MKLLIIIIISVFIFWGCTTIYIPSTLNVPLHTQKGQTIINTGASTNSFIFNGSHSITDEYAIAGSVNVSYGNMFEFTDIADLFYAGELSLGLSGSYNHWNSEVAFGKYKRLSSRNILELYGGLGYGNAKSSENNKNQYGNIFFQTNIGFRRRHLEFGGAFRLSGIYMDYRFIDDYRNVKNMGIPAFCFQYGLMLRTGGESLKFWFSPSMNLGYAFTGQKYSELGAGFEDKNFIR